MAQQANDYKREIKGALYDTLREALTKPTKNKASSFTEDYVKIMLNEAKKNPNGPLGQWLQKQLMADGIIDKLDEQTDKYLQKDQDFLEYRLLKELYDKQREVFLDDKIRHKILIGSRRIGKTVLATRLLVKDCIRPNRHALFISLKFENQIRQAYDETLRIQNEIGLSITNASKVNGQINFSNGSDILFKGNHDKSDADKLLGGKYSLVIIDEVQNQCNMEYLLNTVIGPTTQDYPDSQILLLGTPPRVPGTMCETIWNNYKGWKHYSWTMAENPFLSNVDEIVDTICKEKGITKDAPFIQREYFQKWARDIEAMVYKDYKTYEGEMPTTFKATHSIVSVDFGFADNNAIVNLAYNTHTKQAYVIKEKKFNKATVSDILRETKDSYEYAKNFLLKNGDKDANLGTVAIYTDCNEKSIAYELYSKGLNCFCCYKYDKAYAISQLSDWCRTGKILIPKDGELANEFEQIVYKRDEQDNILPEIDDATFHGDISDALLYGARQMWYDMGDIDLGGESTNKTTQWNEN